MQVIYLFIIMVFINHFDMYCSTKINTFATLIKSYPDFYDIHLIDWRVLLLDMLKDVCFFDEIVSDSRLLVNITRNKTNEVLQIVKITNTLITLISENTKKYQVINMDQLYSTYRELEISSEESLNSYESSIRIANYLKAEYILYSIIYESSKNLYLELQLILSKTGEIIRIINKLI